MKETRITLTKRAMKDLQALPQHIVRKFQTWVDRVERDGLEATRKLPGLHDEPLKGKHQGERSIRLNDGYRAFYVIEDGKVRIVKVIAVNNHDY